MLETKQLVKENQHPRPITPNWWRRLKGKLHLRRVGLIQALVVFGFVCLLYYFSWWAVPSHLQSPISILILVLAVPYVGIQIVGNWILYLVARSPAPPPPAPQELSVDVFVTAFNEPAWMIDLTLTAACNLKGEHTTWLLDDGSDPELARLAEHLGCHYLAREGKEDAKAGNLNAALGCTSGDIVVIFDADHVPEPDFLIGSLGHFTDPRVGFVQVMLTFSANDGGWVERAAIETSLEYYNPTSLGSYGVGGTSMMGSNAVIRRRALESIGGYRPGLAEDLATSIALHAAGWKSAYVAEPMAPGMAPPDFSAWFIQQLKWARGVFELLLTAYPRLFPRLSWGQRLSYAVRMTKYWVGPAVAFHLFATILVMTVGDFQTRIAFHSYLIHITPLVLADALIRYVSLRAWRHQSITGSSLARAVFLVYSTWPIYLQAWLMSVLRVPLSFNPTPKTRSGRLNPLWMVPQFATVTLLMVGALYTVYGIGHPTSILLTFAILQWGLHLVFLARWMSADVLRARTAPRPLSTTQPNGLKPDL